MAIGARGERVLGSVARGVWAALALALAGGACVGCVCTLEDCPNAALVDIGREGAWQEGTYTLELALDDDETRSATFVVPDDLPSEGRSGQLDFGDDRVYASLWQRQECTSTTSKDRNSGSGTCAPIPEAYEIDLELARNPKTVGITLVRDGHTLLEDTRNPRYERLYPNGSDCDEGCSQGSYELTFED